MPEIKRNFQWPAEVDRLFEALCEPVSKKKKWMIITAAIVQFAGSSVTDTNALLNEVSKADNPGGSFGDLVKTATSHRPDLYRRYRELSNENRDNDEDRYPKAARGKRGDS